LVAAIFDLRDTAIREITIIKQKSYSSQ